ncbi:MAG: imidazolonepropionase [Maricaulaceae bacterium]
MKASCAPYGLIPDGAIAISNGRIAWLGPTSELPRTYESYSVEDVAGRLITPSLIDCHTHIVHAGDRAREFEMRLNGASYEDISRTGGGIVSTVKHTREASEDSLLASALPRIDSLIAEGVTTLEIKSGYGLDVANELKMLRVAKLIAQVRPVRIHATYLAAHALPAEYKNNADTYIDEVCIPGLNAAHAAGLVEAVDGFCENIGFTPAQIERVFLTAKSLGLPVKLHAEQLSNLGGAVLASEYNALSADHLEYLDKAGVHAMAKSGTIAVMLPGAFYALRETQAPPIDAFRKAGVPMAVATDCNPGSSPMSSLLLAMNMACIVFRMTPEEALAGTTRNAARALGLTDCGELCAGLRADIAIWNAAHPAELSYHMGFNPLHKRIFGGA